MLRLRSATRAMSETWILLNLGEKLDLRQGVNGTRALGFVGGYGGLLV